MTAVLCDARRGFQPIRVMKIDITHLTHVIWKWFVCPQNVNLPISIWLYSTKITFFFYILKTKSIQAFMNGNNSSTVLSMVTGVKGWFANDITNMAHAITKYTKKDTKNKVILLCIAMYCYVLLCIAMYCYVLLCIAMYCYVCLGHLRLATLGRWPQWAGGHHWAGSHIGQVATVVSLTITNKTQNRDIMLQLVS